MNGNLKKQVGTGAFWEMTKQVTMAEFWELPRSAAEAVAVGSKKFFAGKPCKHGHVAPRYTNGLMCAACDYVNTDRLHRRWREALEDAA
jgi:hypothetical protein